MSAADVEFVTPTSLDEAIEALSHPEAMLVGGGTSIAVLLKNRLIDPRRLVWVGALRELSGTAVVDGELRLGATSTLRELQNSPLVKTHAPVIAEAAGKVGNPRVRSVATLGGALIHGDPRQDIPPVLLALRASVVVVGPTGRREIAISDLYEGFMEVTIDGREVVTEVVVPTRMGWRDAYTRFTPGSEDDYPTVGVAAAVHQDGDGTISDIEVALGGVGPTAFVVDEVRELLIGTRGEDRDLAAASAAAQGRCEPGGDRLGSTEYKRAMVGVWTRRTITACLN